MKRLLLTGGMLLALALAGSDARAQTGTARGKVMDDKGQPIADAVVTLVSNMAARTRMRIEFKPSWFDVNSNEVPDAV